jgi:hypothetical protein
MKRREQQDAQVAAPEEQIRAMVERSHGNLSQLYSELDMIYIYDNNSSEATPLMSLKRRFIEIQLLRRIKQTETNRLATSLSCLGVIFLSPYSPAGYAPFLERTSRPKRQTRNSSLSTTPGLLKKCSW